MFRIVKQTLRVVSTMVFAIILLPFAIITLFFWASLASVRYSFRKLRRDPEMKLRNLVEVPTYNDEEDVIVVDNAIDYFGKITSEIGKKGNAKTGEVLVYRDEEFVDNEKKITITRNVKSKYAEIDFKLVIDINRDREGITTYSSANDGDDFALCGQIEANIKMGKDSVLASIETIIEYYQEAAYFCISILSGKAKINANNQVWVYIEAEKVWMVKMSSSANSWFGYRKRYEHGKARLYWFDGN